MARIVRAFCLLVSLSFAVGSTPDNRILDYLKKVMNESADPCQDFQNYASGKFVELHEKEICYSDNVLIRKRYTDRLQSMFDLLKDRVFIDETSVEEKVWRYYNTCLTAPKNTRRLMAYLDLISPGENITWPSLVARGSQWPKEKFQWLETLAHLRRYGMENLLIRIRIEPDQRDSTKFSLYQYVPDGKLGTNLHTFNDLSTITSLLIGSGVGKNRAAPFARSVINLAADLEALAGIQSSNSGYYNLEDIVKRTGIQLDKYLEIIFGRPFESSFEIYIYNMEYLEGLNGVLRRYDNEVVANYLVVQLSLFLLGLDGRLVKRELTCTAAVAVQMELASDLLYKNYYLGQGKFEKYTKEVQRLFDALSQTFLNKLGENRFHLTDNEVSHLQQKLLAMSVTVGKMPHDVNHRRFVTNFYEDLELDTEPNFARAQLKDPKPHFFESGNTIVVPFDMLHEPFFVPESHDVFKMSLMGFSLARPILKSFEPYFLNVDSQGNLGQMLRDFEGNQGYIDALSCLNRTQAKEINKRASYVASLDLIYETYFGNNSEFNQNQPEFTDVPLKQLFLLNYAQEFVGTEKYLSYFESESDTALISESVKNLPAFGEIFSCPTSAPLNPEEKCPEDVLKFVGNESVVDHFKLVTRDGNSLLIGAR
ncbi:hypothetical protein M5D96_003954 [Drosophila gunungcola]|uniref:Uncharacterized protein n=1 Tax=Drosophila gunungcola TaxID=103775 RepID=A0A9P9YTT4_9MUSC|nr:hypothetical protein M5D96_003954 [Drosophila gunungcola]